MKKTITLLLLIFTVNSYAQNICRMMHEHPTWLWAAENTERKWGVPVSVQFAIMQEESGFFSQAQTPGPKVFGITLWHQSTAEGYSQALNGTWRSYVKATHKISANRSSFSEASDFIGWYVYSLYRYLHLPKYDAYRIYLAYHEGMGGYRSGTYRHKPWLIVIAHKVGWRATLNHRELLNCESTLPKRPAWWL